MDLIGTKTRRLILSHTLLQPDREFYLRELVRSSGLAPRSVQLELDRLVAAGILLERRSGNRRYVRANRLHPSHRALREIVEQSEGFQGVLRDSLGTEGITLALVFGSTAGGTARPDSDIDVLVVGRVGLREVVQRLAPAQMRLGRDINPVVWTDSELARRLASEDRFLERVRGGAIVALIGDEREFARLGR